MPDSAASSLQAAIVARKYYLLGISKSDIAGQLGISRFRVARMLDDAIQSGMVQIRVDFPVEYDAEQADRISSRFAIRSSVVARTIVEDPEASAAVLSSAAAAFLEGALGRRDVLGVSWGRTLSQVIQAVSARSAATVVQIVGGVSSTRSDVSGVDLVHLLASRIGGQGYPLLAPLFVGSAGVAEQLRRDPSLGATTSLFDRITMVVMGIGSWDPPLSVVFEEATPAERSALQGLRAAADMCGIVVDADGKELTTDLQRRRIGISSMQLRRVATKVAVAAGAEKASAISAALRSGLVDVLVTDSAAATALLAGE